jgi:hypothetical protein
MRTKTTLLAVVLLATGAATSALAGPSDELRRTAIAQVAVAGSVAGLARACGVEPTPITAAIRQMFNRLQLDGTTEAAALARYHASESRMTRETQGIPGAPPCTDLYATMQQTVIDLGSVGTQKSAARPEASESSAAD